jgi:hypothetical protein
MSTVDALLLCCCCCWLAGGRWLLVNARIAVWRVGAQAKQGLFLLHDENTAVLL